ncbi:BatD family protein [Acidobacteriota bacterium]
MKAKQYHGKKSILIGMLLLLFSYSGFLLADEVEVRASVNAEKIGLDDVLIYTIVLKGIQNPSQPDISGLSTFKIAQTSRSFRTEIINGVLSQSVEFVFFLTPAKTGALNIPPFNYEYNGRKYKTQPFTIVVVKGSLGTSQPQRRRSIFDDDFFGPSRRERRQPQEIDVLLKAELSKGNVVKGEQVIYKVLLYSRNTIESVNMTSNQSFSGFWQEWYPVPQTIHSANGTLNGKNYKVFEVRKAALFPTGTGTITIPSIKFELLLREDSFSIFSDTKRIYRSSPEIKINVSELPGDAEGLPVGRFNLEVRANKKEININDILTLKVKINGRGNIKTLDVPSYESGNYYKIYPAKISRSSNYNEDYLSGTVEAEVPVSFKETGLISFPAVELKYYEPDMARVVSKSSAPIIIRVTGTKEKEENAATVPRTEIVKKGEDIDFIKTGNIYDQRNKFYKSGLFKILFILFFLLNLLFILKILIFDRFISQSEILKKKKLLNKTISNLRSIREYGGIFPILENYLKRKAGLGLAEINNFSIENLFEKHGVSNNDIKSFVRIKSESESSRFSPVKKSGKELKQDIKILIDIVKRIDGKIK